MVHRFWNMVCDFILSLPGVFIIISNTGTDAICLRGSHGSDVGLGRTVFMSGNYCLVDSGSRKTSTDRSSPNVTKEKCKTPKISVQAQA